MSSLEWAYPRAGSIDAVPRVPGGGDKVPKVVVNGVPALGAILPPSYGAARVLGGFTPRSRHILGLRGEETHHVSIPAIVRSVT